jgi:putative FmdB family regulatory protein
MPIYEYRCSECGFQEEHLQKASEPPLTACPACGKPTFKKMLSAAGFQLKGSGWYATDFKRSGQPAAAKSEAKGEAKAEGKAAGKAEANSGAGTEAKAEPKSGGKTDSAKPATATATPSSKSNE